MNPTKLDSTYRTASTACLALGMALVLATASSHAAVGEVIVVFKTHFDIGYTDMASNVVQRYRTTMIDQALDVVDANRNLPPEQQFVWTLPGWPLTKILEAWPGQTAERQARVGAAFKSGRFVTHALPFTTHTELLELEDLVRGLGYASRLSREAGLPLPRDAKMTDVPSHSWILPTLLRHAGVDFLHLGCNAASRSPVVPSLFWWEGPDGSRVLTMYTAESYGTGLVPPANWPYQTWLALIHTGDNHGPPRPDEVRHLLDEAKVKLPGVPLRIGRLSDFADALIAEKANIPVVRGDMPDTWIHGLLSDPRGASLARRRRPQLAMGEALNTLLGRWGAASAPAREAVARGYEQSLLYGEHTWGGAYWWIYGKYLAYYGDRWREERKAGRFDRLESSWAEHTAYIEQASKLSGDLLDHELQTLVRSVKVEGQRVVVFNPLPWTRDGLVSTSASRQAGPPFVALQPTDGGPAEPVGKDGSFHARKLPPLGYRTFVPVDVAPPPSPKGLTFDPIEARLESPFFRLVLDTNRFVIRSLWDKRGGRELVDLKARHGFGQFVHERFSSNEVAAFVKAYVKIDSDWATNELGKPMLPPASEASYRSASPAGFKVNYTASGACVTVTGIPERQGENGLPALSVAVTLPADQPFVDISFTIHKPEPEPWPEAGWIALPFKIEAPRFRLGRLGSIIDPDTDVVPGSNRYLFGLNTGLTLTDGSGTGIGLCAGDSPLVSLGEPGCWKYSMDPPARTPAVYVNLFNNQWTTNFRLWTAGEWTSQVRLWAVSTGQDAAESLVTPSLEARFPLQVAAANGPGGKLIPAAPGLELSRRGVQITAFGPNPDGPGTILRLWELAGQSGPCRVRWPGVSDTASAQLVDLRGRDLGPAIGAADGVWTVPLRAFAPTTLVLPAIGVDAAR